MSDREAFLERIRARRPLPGPGEPVPSVAGERVQGRRLAEGFLGRWRESGGGAQIIPTRDAPARVESVLRERDGRRVRLWRHELVDAMDLAATLMAGGFDVACGDEGLEAELHGTAGAQAGIVVATLAVAATGTMALVAGPGCPRATSLLPPTLVILCQAHDIVDRTSAMWGRLALSGRSTPSNVALVSGPSSSADIEGDLIRGVHGPADVVALILDPG